MDEELTTRADNRLMYTFCTYCADALDQIDLGSRLES